MNKYKEAKMNNKCALVWFARDEFNASQQKKSFESEKQVVGELNASVLFFSINEWELSIYRFSTSNTKKCINKLFLVELCSTD